MRHLHRNRILARRGNRALVFFAPLWANLLLVGLAISFATVAILTDYLLAGAIAIGVVILTWLGLSLQLTRLEPSGRRRDRPAPPGGADVREPRRPLPNAPSGAAEMPIPDELPSP